MFDNLTPAQNSFAGREIASPDMAAAGLRFLNKRHGCGRQAGHQLPKLDVVVAMMLAVSARRSLLRGLRPSLPGTSCKAEARNPLRDSY
ncbi:hypothetical protein [Mesorhizobium escarrei]|uniref:hypothetical protein n=1 Tax=Mesorhizobium escarrei TaxID=666018 RepID=UPI0020A7E6D7|nr:hypothetical protein [Mesorhizobium escarrei]